MKQKETEYPVKIYATGKTGSNGILCLDYRDYDEDVEYVRADAIIEEIKFLAENEAVYSSEVSNIRVLPKNIFIEKLNSLKGKQ